MQGPVVQPFSYDEAHPYSAGQHRGVDIGADAAGESVVAPAAGTVSFAGTVAANGKSVTIETADGYSVTLTHLGSISVAKGATVAEQGVVGTVGPSGTPEVDGPYVHLGIRVTADPNGYVDPLGLLPPAAGDVARRPAPPHRSRPRGAPASTAPASKPARAGAESAAAATAHEPVRSRIRVHRQEPCAEAARRARPTPGVGSALPYEIARASRGALPTPARAGSTPTDIGAGHEPGRPRTCVPRRRAVEPASRARVQLGCRAVRARCGARRAAATRRARRRP